MFSFSQIRQITNNLSYSQYMERSENPQHSRKNSNEESQVSTRQQLNTREEPLTHHLSRQIHTHQLQVSPFCASNYHPNSLMLNQENLKNCRECKLTQKRANLLEWELRGQRHKVARLRQIIRVKTDKQQELQKAYLDIAIQLKKKMQASSLKKPVNNEVDPNSLSQSRNLLIRLGSQVESLQADVKRLMVEVEYWRAKSQQIKVQVQASEGLETVVPQSKQKAFNSFYQKEIDRLQHKIQQLEFQLSRKELEPKTAETNRLNMAKILFPKKAEGQQCELNHQVQGREEQPLGVDRAQTLKKQTQRVNLSVVCLSEAPYKQDQFVSVEQEGEKLSFYELRQQRDSLNEYASISCKSIAPEELSFKTAQNFIDHSFQSIHSKKKSSRIMHSVCEPWSSYLILESSAPKPSQYSPQFHSINDQPSFHSLSNVLNQISVDYSHHESQKSWREILQNSLNKYRIHQQTQHQISQQGPNRLSEDRQKLKILNEQMKTQLELERQSTKNIINQIYSFLDQLINTLNKFVEQYSLALNSQIVMKLQHNRSKESSKVLDSAQLQIFLKDLQQKLNTIGRSGPNQFQKLANDRQLQLSQIRIKKQQYEGEIDNLNHKVQFLLQYNRKLEFQVAELSNSAFTANPSYDRQRNNYMRSIYRRRISLVEPEVVNQMVECNLLQSNSNQLKQEQFRSNSYKCAILHFTESINRAININKPTQDHFKLNFDKCLIAQIDRMLESSFDMLNSPIRRRKSSGFIQSTPKKSLASLQVAQIDALAMLQAENQQLKVQEAQKTESIQQLKSIIEKLKKQLQNHQNIINDLKAQIQQLNDNTKNIHPSIKQPDRPLIGHTHSHANLQQDEQFMDYSQIKEFNNLHWGHDEEIKQLRQKLGACQAEVCKLKAQRKRTKSRVFYVSN